MPKDWETRALIGAALLTVIIPMGVTALVAEKVVFPQWAVIALAGIWCLAFAGALSLFLPYRVLRLGKRYSDVRHALWLELLAEVFSDDGKVGDVQPVAKIHNTNPKRAIRYAVHHMVVTIGDSPSQSNKGTGEKFMPPGGSTNFVGPRMKGLDLTKEVRAVVTFDSVYGPAEGKFEVEWAQDMDLSVSQRSSPSLGVAVSPGQVMSDIASGHRSPPIYRLIKPLKQLPQ